MNRKTVLETIKENNKPIIIFGAGAAGKRVYASMKKLGLEPLCFCDNYKTDDNSKLHAKIISPEHLVLNYPYAIVIVCITLLKIQNEVISQLKELSFPEKQIIAFDEIVTALSDYEFEWKDFELTFDYNTNEPYIKRMSYWIDDQDKSVMDFGAGSCILKKFLHNDVEYTPLDYIARTPEFIVYDFNKDPFPDLSADVLFLSYCLPYVEEKNIDGLLDNVFYAARRKVIISFCVAKDGNIGTAFKKLYGAKTIFYSADAVFGAAKRNKFALKDSFIIAGEEGLPSDRQHFLFSKQ